ncbi:MAG: hypothetical protein KDK62_03520 [Chlamydiia bacterium]|nr:hypothetical protein [Chlamydiia bacterium]
MNIRIWVALFCLVIAKGAADDADISFFIADLKFNSVKGIKVCEIQPGVLSTFRGDRFSNGGKGLIDKRFCDEILSFGLPIWTLSGVFTDSGIKSLLPKRSAVEVKSTLQALKADKKLAKLAKVPPKNPENISDYKALFIGRFLSSQEILELKALFPGMLILDADTRAYWRDKQAVSLLFRKSPQIQSLRPLWNYYAKSSDSDLAVRILNEIPSDYLVVKPRGKSRGNGVIILPSTDLKKTLEYIFSSTRALKVDPDPSFSSWYQDEDETFLVEEFFPSDPLFVPHLNMKPYEPTLRIVFLMVQDEGVHSIRFLGGFWTLPSKSLTENGSFTEKTKTCCQFPFYAKADPAVVEAAEEVLGVAMPILHRLMLDERRYGQDP